MKRAARGAPHLYYPNGRIFRSGVCVSRRPSSPNLLCPRHLALGRDHLKIVSPTATWRPRCSSTQRASAAGEANMPIAVGCVACRVSRILVAGLSDFWTLADLSAARADPSGTTSIVAAINVLKRVAICFQGAHAPPFDEKSTTRMMMP